MASSSVDITALTAKQIIEYSSKSSFAMATDDYDITANHGADLSTKTKTINETVGVIKSLDEKLQTIQSNLEQMYISALEGASTSASSQDKQSAYAQLRSLSAGIDQLVNDYKLDDTKVLAGQTFTFTSGNGSVTYKQKNLSSSLNGGLGLSEKQEGRNVSLDLDYLSYLKNLKSEVRKAVQVDSVSYNMPSNSTAALKEGDYYVKVNYMDDKSTVQLTSLDGVAIETLEDVDLTGVGSKSLSFKSGLGVKIDYDETQLSDNYNWETHGKNEVYYTVTVDETYQHVLKTDTEGAVNTKNSAKLNFLSRMRGDTGKLSFSVGSKDEKNGKQLDTGSYNMKFEYKGEKSSIWLYDEQGSLVGIKRGIDATQDGKTEVDLDNGLTVTIDNDNFSYDGKKTKNMGVSYVNGNSAYEDFNFDEYAEKISDAYKEVTKQLESLYKADESVTKLYKYLQQATSSSSSSSDASVLASQGVSSLLTDYAINTENNPFFASTNATASLTAAASSIFGSLESNYTTVSDADYSVLAKYY